MDSNVTSTTDIELRVFHFAILIATSLLTLAGNALVLSVVYSDIQLHKPSFYLFCNLAVADFMVGLSYIPFYSVSVLEEAWLFGMSWCMGHAASISTSFNCSLMTLALISLDRLLTIAYPFRYQEKVTTFKTVIIILVIWIHSIMWAIFPLLGWGALKYDVNSNTCRPDWGATGVDKLYSMGLALVAFLLPTITIAVSNLKIYFTARVQINRIKKLTVQSRDKKYNSRDENHVRRNEQPEQSLDCAQNVSESRELNVERNLSRDKKDNSRDKNLQAEQSFDCAHNLSESRELNGESNRSRAHPSELVNNSIDARAYSGDEIAKAKERKRLNKKIKKLKNRQVNNSKAWKTICIVIGVFIACWLPYTVLSSINMITKGSWGMPSWLTHFALTVTLINSCCNPIIYSTRDKRFKTGFRRVIRRWIGKWTAVRSFRDRNRSRYTQSSQSQKQENMRRRQKIYQKDVMLYQTASDISGHELTELDVQMLSYSSDKYTIFANPSILPDILVNEHNDLTCRQNEEVTEMFVLEQAGNCENTVCDSRL